MSHKRRTDMYRMGHRPWRAREREQWPVIRPQPAAVHRLTGDVGRATLQPGLRFASIVTIPRRATEDPMRERIQKHGRAPTTKTPPGSAAPASTLPWQG